MTCTSRRDAQHASPASKDQKQMMHWHLWGMDCLPAPHTRLTFLLEHDEMWGKFHMVDCSLRRRHMHMPKISIRTTGSPITNQRMMQHLEVVEVNVWQARNEQLQLLRREDADELGWHQLVEA